jgi:hypothetical protein
MLDEVPKKNIELRVLLVTYTAGEHSSKFGTKFKTTYNVSEQASSLWDEGRGNNRIMMRNEEEAEEEGGGQVNLNSS